jgi:hypothetical protein
VTGWFHASATPQTGTATSTLDATAEPVADVAASYREMSRWEPASGAELRLGDVICVDAAAVSALIALDAAGVDWTRLQEHSFVIAAVSSRRGTWFVTLHGLAGRLALDHEVVLRLVGPT